MSDNGVSTDIFKLPKVQIKYFLCKISYFVVKCAAIIEKSSTNELRHEKTQHFAYAKTKMKNGYAVTAKQISAFVFTTRIVQSLFFLIPKFPVSSHLLCLYSWVCVRPVQKPHWFSHEAAQGNYGSKQFHMILQFQSKFKLPKISCCL